MAELLFGIGLRPRGRRTDVLTSWVEEVAATFATRTLAFDIGSARAYASLAARARAVGRGFPMPDGYIAAIASQHGFAVATRDESAFAAVGIRLINPWAG